MSMAFIFGILGWIVLYTLVIGIFTGIRPIKRTSFESVAMGWLIKGRVRFSDAWIKNWIGRGRKQDIFAKIEPKHGAIDIEVDPDISGTLLSFKPSLATMLGLTRLGKVTIYVSSEAEKETWQEFLEKKLQQHYFEKQRSRIHEPQKVMPPRF